MPLRLTHSLAAALLLLASSPILLRAQQAQPAVTISAVMIDPTAVPDDVGEWLELHNATPHAVVLSGWQLLSAHDAGFTIPAGLVIPAGGSMILARNADPAVNGGVRAAATYQGLTFANRSDWLVLKDASGVTRDSVAWEHVIPGVPIHPHGARPAVADSAPSKRHDSVRLPPYVPTAAPRELVVRLLDIGQGDAVLIQNGGSTVLVDGGPNPHALGAHLDALGLNGGTIDAVILTHAHSDHYQGLRELFASRRHITVRYFWENKDPSPNRTLAKLRDSIAARVHAGTLTYRDSDDPCANGQPLCVITLKGGARLEIMRPDPIGQGPNNRSPALKLVGPDSASFTMWLAGDAEHQATDWFSGAAGYDRQPGMRADVLKADHHGSCNGVNDRYLNAVHPSLVVVSVGAVNDYGHMHTQAKAAFARRGIPWYRTDQNGTITLRSPGTPGGKFTVSVERGTTSMNGPSDRRSTQPDCR